ncbi:GGDEF domain-containing protein [Mesorhizobium sp. J428]|uniref:GGDEF domain-containing protein n=1 Tax=Mesorhizobium sp. J428 TaxID=2898440 RepID=UPI002150E86A|nr:GGDEF domain-containing protein [Mesorhizobium sp. J428]MCR5858197.1 GGDEF domain-containing protein [Mesorhizobium sp. J428]
MRFDRLDLSVRGKARVYLGTIFGTLFCIAAAFAIDSYSFETGTWQLGEKPLNNFIIPLVVAPPIFYFLLSKLRELSIAHHELMNVAATDPLTSCLNRRAFTALVDGYLERVEKQQDLGSGAFLVVDVDHFKTVNDNYGHEFGDEALKLIAVTIKSSVREIDLVGRLGGEEFGVFLPSLDAARTVIVADRIRAAVGSLPFSPRGRPHRLSISIGGTTFDRRATFADLYRSADERLYVAKNAGRDRVDITPYGTGAAA